MKSRQEFFLGLDLGGTNINAGIITKAGKLLAHASLPTAESSDLSPRAVITRMIAAAHAAAEASKVPLKTVQAIGIVSPGILDMKRGVVTRAANFPRWKNVPLSRHISAALGIPAILENDARAAAFGEWWAGAGKRADPFVLLTLGTGIGGGIVINGRLLHGATDLAGEVGHTIIAPGGALCGCGQRGCLERYCSGHYFAGHVMRKLSESRDLPAASSLMPRFMVSGTVTTEEIAAHARKGDTFAAQAWDDLCRHLATACLNISRLIDPKMIALGGGVSGAGMFLLRPIRRHLAQQWWKIGKPHVKIVLAELGGKAGVIGAAGIAMHAHESGTLPAPESYR